MTQHVISSRRRRGLDLPAVASASFSLVSFARVALADVPCLPPDVVDEMVRGGTLGENLAALAAVRPEVVEAKRWRGLIRAVSTKTRTRARALGIREPLEILDLVESAGTNG
jgi:hypothetical protein